MHADDEILVEFLIGSWIVKVVGGADVADSSNTFNIDRRNVVAVKKILRQLRMAPWAEDRGKNYRRPSPSRWPGAG